MQLMWSHASAGGWFEGVVGRSDWVGLVGEARAGIGTGFYLGLLPAISIADQAWKDRGRVGAVLLFGVALLALESYMILLLHLCCSALLLHAMQPGVNTERNGSTLSGLDD